MGFFQAGEPAGPVGSGIDCFLMQDTRVLGWSTDLNVSEDFMLEGVQSLGNYGYRNLLSLGYDCNMTMGTFLLRGADIVDSVSIPGWQADGSCNINSAGLYTFTGIDVHSVASGTPLILFTIIGAKYGGGDLSVAQGQLMSRQTRWRARHMLPGAATS